MVDGMKHNAKILLADDDGLVREAVVRILEMFGHEVIAVEGGREALDLADESFDLIILDINMPDVDGFEVMEGLNRRKLSVPVLFLTGAGSMEYAVRAINLGAYDFISKPIEDLDMFNVKIRRALEKRMYVLQEKAYKDNLEREVRAKTRELEEKNQLLEEYSEQLETTVFKTITTLQVAMEEKDQYTAGHTTRVTEYARMIAEKLGLDKAETDVLDRACRLHDIGKLVIDLSCIQKAGPLNDEEWEQIKKHPEVGQNIIKPLGFLDREGLIVRHHHERLDGKGYPDGIGGDEIDLLTRIIIVSDSYDAMTSKRIYRVNMSMEEGLAELERCAGAQFDPEVVKAFSAVLHERRQRQLHRAEFRDF
jgi:putative nucleotidyltransferase with HDIG domain